MELKNVYTLAGAPIEFEVCPRRSRVSSITPQICPGRKSSLEFLRVHGLLARTLPPCFDQALLAIFCGLRFLDRFGVHVAGLYLLHNLLMSIQFFTVHGGRPFILVWLDVVTFLDTMTLAANYIKWPLPQSLRMFNKKTSIMFGWFIATSIESLTCSHRFAGLLIGAGTMYHSFFFIQHRHFSRGKKRTWH